MTSRRYSQNSAELALAFDTQRVLQHWTELRQGLDIPTVADWVQSLPAWMAPNVYRGEVLSQDVFTVFAGSTILERRGTAGKVGQSMFPPTVIAKRPGVALVHAVVSQPCGLVSEVSYTSNGGGTIRTQTILLPMRVPTGALPQFVGFVVDLLPRLSTQYIVGNAHDQHFTWLDIGSGTPNGDLIESAEASMTAFREGQITET